jgi:hypothetical protein
VPLVADFLGASVPDGGPPLPASADLKRRRTIELLAGWNLEPLSM